MPTRHTLVLAGFPELADALERSGRFARVVAPESTSQLRDRLGDLRQVPADQLLFAFADTLPVDTPQTLEFLVQKLVGSGYRVVMLELGPSARELASRSGGAVGLVPGPFHVNAVLGALSGVAGMDHLEPLGETWATAEVRPGVPAPSATPGWEEVAPAAAPAAAPAQGGWAAAPADPWASSDQPAPQPAPQPDPSSWAPQPDAAAGAWAPAPTDPWAASDQPAPQPAPQDAQSSWAPAPAAAPAPSAGWADPAPAPAWGPGADAPSDPAPTWAPEPATVPAQAWSPEPQQGGWAPEPQPVQGGGQSWTDVTTQPAPDTSWSQDPAPGAQPWDLPPQPDSLTQPWDQSPDQAPAPAAGGWAEQAMAPAQPSPQGWSDQGPAAAQPSGFGSRRGFVLVVAAPKGGVGKSTLSTNLAAYMGTKLQQTGKTVMILDTNVQNPDVGKVLGQYRPTVVDVARQANQMTPQVIQQSMISRRDLNLDALLGPESPEKASPAYINGRLYRDITAELKRSYDYIVVDTSVADMYHDVFMNFVLPEMDYMMLVTIPNLQTLLGTDQFLRYITADRHAGGFGVDPRHIGVVLNQAQEGIGAEERDVREELAAWQYLGMIPWSKEWLKAVNQHELVATKNYTDLNAAFDTILYQITGEPVFAPAQSAGAARGGLKGLLGGLGARKRKG